jgi:glyoxylase-like metal-dependent hydrolase (beta-lactamase superfamily II)
LDASQTAIVMTADANNHWFTITTIDAQTYAISECGHWEKVHCYLFIGDKQAALIDTGTGIGKIRPIVEQLTSLPVIVITTHVHWDHIGGHREFGEIAVHEGDRVWLENGLPIPLSVMRQMLIKHPFTRPAPSEFSLESWSPFVGAATLVVEDNHAFNLGGRTLQALHTPGHSPGHLCIWEEEKGYLVTGDLLYEGTLFAFYESTDPVQYAASVARLHDLIGITRLLPGHNNLDITVNLLDEAHKAFQSLKHNELLRHGSGEHQFKHVSIRL